MLTVTLKWPNPCGILFCIFISEQNCVIKYQCAVKIFLAANGIFTFGAMSKLWPHVTRLTTCEICDHMWTAWPHVNSVTTCDKCDHISLVSSHMTSVTTSWTTGHHGHLDIMDIWTSRTFGHHRHLDMWQLWPHLTHVTTCDNYEEMWHLTTCDN